MSLANEQRGESGPANWLAIAQRDFANARRSRILALAIGLFAALVAIVMATSSTTGEQAASDALWNLQAIAIWFMPIVVLVIGYLSIARERETGRIKYLLGLPNTRLDIIIGKFLSRAAVSLLAVFVSMTLGAAIMAVRFDSFPTAEVVGLAGFMGVFAIVYTGIAVGISALTASRARAMTGVLGVYVLFTIFWIVPSVNPTESLAYIVEDLLGLSSKENFYEFVFHLSPSFAYSRLTNTMVFEREQSGAALPDAADPFYLQGEFMAVILLCWLVGMLALGYWRFRDAELV